MRNRIDKAVVLLVAANFTDQKNRIQDKASDDGGEKNDAEKNFDALAPVENDPSAAHGERHRRQANAQREEGINGLLPADDAHKEIVAGRGEGVRSQAFSEVMSVTGIHRQLPKRLVRQS